MPHIFANAEVCSSLPADPLLEGSSDYYVNMAGSLLLLQATFQAVGSSNYRSDSLIALSDNTCIETKD
jgi:hypothetical protein